LNARFFISRSNSTQNSLFSNKVWFNMKLVQWIRLAGIASLMVLANCGVGLTLSRESLINALQAGGLVIVMRHASSPRQPPDSETINSDNTNSERQLDETGRSNAKAFGDSLERLRIPIAVVESSPTYRTLETARMAGFSDIDIRVELGSQGMQSSSAAYASWLQNRVRTIPLQGNHLLITHEPNIVGAYPDLNSSPLQGEALIFDPSEDQTGPIARVTISEWLDW
jgi:phosphohistidine phosphatase SixA